MPLSAALRETLRSVTRAMAPATGPWWIIGSAAAALHGAPRLRVRDIDVLLAPADAARVFAALGLQPAALPPHPRFRSAAFATWRDPPLPVEFMAGLAVFAAPRWAPVMPRTHITIARDGVIAPVPARAELIALLTAFGRAKDRRRARILAGVG